MRMIAICTLLSAVASASTTSHPHEPPATCEMAAARIVRMMAQDDRVKTPARIQPLLVSHCTADHWSYAARSCIVYAADADGCDTFLTPAQTAAFRASVAQLR